MTCDSRDAGSGGSENCSNAPTPCAQLCSAPSWSERSVSSTSACACMACRSSVSKRARAVGAVVVNSSSAWSTVTSTVASRRSAAISTSVNSAGSAASPCCSRSRRSAHCAGRPSASASDLANSATGASPGRSGGSGTKSVSNLASRGSTPARTSEDLPDPEAPSTTTMRAPPIVRRARRRSMSSRTSASRPK